MARINTNVETINPAKARTYLASNGENRRVSRKTVLKYADAMRKGQWSLTGEPIIFDRSDRLMDGQHRLHACIESGTSFQSVVMRGIDSTSFVDINTGRTRSPGDVLYIAGYSRGKLAAAAIKVIWGMEAMENDANVNSLRKIGVTRQDLIAFMEEHEEELGEAVSVVDGDGKDILRPPSLFVGLRYRFGRANRLRAQEFFDALSTGADLSSSSPIWKLRSLLIKELGAKNLRHSNEWKAAITIKAWNAWLRGKDVRQLRWREDEDWPRIYEKMKPQRRRKRST